MQHRINDTATVSLVINGEQAKAELENIETALSAAKNKLVELQNKGADSKSIRSVQKEIRTLERRLEQTQSRTEGVKKALMGMDGMAPRELNRALRTLMGRLTNIQRGSKDWYAHVEAIKTIKARLAELNEELKVSKSRWEQFKDWALSAWPALDLLNQWGSSFFDVMRGSVDAFASMDQEMANVRKFTGMTEEQVASLNEEFKKMDTRTSREGLNKLAQEAGRLGLSSQQDVLGFVRAADKINVALDDLGEGATLTLSKLTDIFGDKDRYGVEQSLLKTGSVINELSQSCSASAPYIAAFAKRMGGVGVQAKMTVSEIMGFGAVLDSLGLEVEASSTALSQVLVRMMRDPAKYAKTAGLEVESFSRLLREDANEALITFLDALNKAGGMNDLAPMFADMGENGSRAITTLTSLAERVDLVRQRQEEAAVAFKEGVSIDKEFEVQNNTVQASLEKAKKAANELRVELGERLSPLMSHLITSTSAITRALLTVTKFIFEHKGAIVVLSASVTAYLVVIKAAVIWQKTWTAICITGQALLLAWSGAVKIGAAAVALFSGNIRKAHLIWNSFARSIHANPLGLLIAAITTVIGLLVVFTKKVAAATSETERLARAQKMLDDIKKEAVKRAGEEAVKLNLLRDAAKNELLTLEERKKAVDKLNATIPDYNAYIDETTGKYVESTEALNAFNEALTRQFELEGAKDKLAELGKQKVAATLDVNAAQKAYNNAVENMKDGKGSHSYTTSFGMVGNTMTGLLPHLKSVLADRQAALAEIKAKEDAILNAYGVDLQKKALSETTTETPEPDDNNNNPDRPKVPTPSAKDRFAEEKAWRERQEAEARIAYASGETSYAEHAARMAEIAVDYHEKMLLHDDLTSDEELKILADYWEAVNKETVAGNKILIDEENRNYQDLLDRLRDNHAARLDQEGMSAAELQREADYYAEVRELAELEHLRNIMNLYDEGSEDRLRAEREFQEKQIAAQERHLKRTEELEKTYAEMKKKYFGMNQDEKNAEFDRQINLLNEVYNRELAAAGDNEAEKLRIKEAYMAAELALRQEFDQEVADSSTSSYQKAIGAAAEWLKSEGGQALTQSLSTVVSGMSSIFSGLSSMIQAELEIQTADIEKRYDREIEYAEGNSFKIAKLEKQKEADIAKAKNEANRKMFAMQVIQAVAQTATNAINAYGSAAAIPVVGHIMAPIAAAMAIAAGAIQIATIKKQQAAAQTQGYSKGGFTKPGPVDEPAGIVHAGEWVASQKLLANPVARPMIEALDRAQRTNTIGSLKPEDVSRSIRANDSLARIAEDDAQAALMVAAFAQNTRAVGSLVKRLSEPFVTVNTVAGDQGINNALDEHRRLIKNKTPKSRRKAYADSDK